MSCLVTHGEIREFVDRFVVENDIEGYSSLELINYIYKILYVGYRVHQWQYNNFAIYTLARMCYEVLYSVGLDIEEVFYFYLNRDLKSSLMTSLSGVEAFESYMKNSVLGYADLITRDINNLEIMILTEYQYDYAISNYEKYRICGYLANKIVEHFYEDFIQKNMEKILRYVTEVLRLYYDLYKRIGKIKEYYFFIDAGKIEREAALLYNQGDLLMMCNNVFNKINYLDLFTDFKMQDNGKIAVINNHAFYRRWCDLSKL